MRLSKYLVRRPTKGNPSRAIKSDPQRHKVYAMERSIIGSSIYSSVPLHILQAIADNACKAERAPLVKVRLVEEKGALFGYWEDGYVCLNQNYHGANIGVLLHEVAHAITDYWFEGIGLPDHSPEWAYTYLKLLDKYNVIPKYAMLEICRRFEVEVAL